MGVEVFAGLGVRLEDLDDPRREVLDGRLEVVDEPGRPPRLVVCDELELRGELVGQFILLQDRLGRRLRAVLPPGGQQQPPAVMDEPVRGRGSANAASGMTASMARAARGKRRVFFMLLVFFGTMGSAPRPGCP